MKIRSLRIFGLHLGTLIAFSLLISCGSGNSGNDTQEKTDYKKIVQQPAKVNPGTIAPNAGLTEEITPIEGGVTLATLFEQANELAGKEVIITGKVVKMNHRIMKRNWIHIQDGTSFGEFYDLTVTTTEEMNFKEGDVISIKGKLILDKDFGSGYYYKYLVEEATVLPSV